MEISVRRSNATPIRHCLSHRMRMLQVLAYATRINARSALTHTGGSP